MTVIKGKQKYSFPTIPTSSGNTTDVESLHLGSASASDTESINNERPAVTRGFSSSSAINQARVIEELLALKKCSGRKKQRRYQNRHLLQTLAEEEEGDDGALVVIMEPYKSPFAKLLDDNDALQFWNVFVDKSEEEQAKVLEVFSRRFNNNETKKERPFSRISQNIRRTIKIKKNLSLEQVKLSEDNLIAFFKATPEKVYTQHPPTYFQRLLLYAIAQYHGLQSLSVMEHGRKKVEIFNSLHEWIPADCFLTDFIAQLRK